MNEKDIEFITKMVIQSLNNTGVPSQKNEEIPVGVSARHIHLSEADVTTLFGQGYKLTVKKELMGGQFACNETVSVISPKMKIIENIRVLGPVRKVTQLEVAATDSFKLGIKVPLRNSGDVKESAGFTLLGPKGSVTLKEGCIIAARHIHMSLEDAQKFGVKNGEIVKVEFEGDRGVVFNNVILRVDASYRLEMHIDTDEANAASIKTGNTVKLLKG